MVPSEPSAVEYRLLEHVDKIKKSSNVSVADLEEYNKILVSVYEKIRELRESRDNWKAKYHSLRFDGKG